MVEETELAELLTISEAAERMHVSRQTIYTWISEGKVRPVLTPGGRRRIPAHRLIIEKSEPAEEVVSGVFPVRDISELDPERIEQIGTKEKYWFSRTAKHWYWECEGDEFLFKAGRQGTGDNWAERVACGLCGLLGLPHAEYDLATHGKKKGVITPNFVPRGAWLVLGNEILFRYRQSYDRAKRYRQSKHTVGVVLAVVGNKAVGPPPGLSSPDGINSARDFFVGYLMLDALIANQDRHHENWGLVIIPEDGTCYLAPTFDHASSLGRNESDISRDDRLNTRDINRSMDRYVQRAKSAFYGTPTATRPLSTLEAFVEAAKRNRDAARCWLDRLEKISPSDARSIIDLVPQGEMSQVAKEFTHRIIELNRQRLLCTEV